MSKEPSVCPNDGRTLKAKPIESERKNGCMNYDRGARCLFWKHLRCGPKPCMMNYVRMTCPHCGFEENGAGNRYG